MGPGIFLFLGGLSVGGIRPSTLEEVSRDSLNWGRAGQGASVPFDDALEAGCVRGTLNSPNAGIAQSHISHPGLNYHLEGTRLPSLG